MSPQISSPPTPTSPPQIPPAPRNTTKQTSSPSPPTSHPTSVPPSHAILLRYNHSSNALAFERVLDFPGGHSKFAIRYDSASGLYVSLVNNVTSTPDQWLISETARLARTPLALSVSADLVTWTTIAPILWDDTGA